MFGSWRVEIVVGCTVRGYPFYQLLPLARRRRAHAGAPGSGPTTHRAGPLPAAAAHARAGHQPWARAWERHNAGERPDQTQPHNGPASPAPRAHARAGRRRRAPEPTACLRGTEHAALLGARQPRRGPPGRRAGKSRPGAGKPSSGRRRPPRGGVSRHRKQDNKRHHPDQNQRTSRSTEPKKPTKGLRL